MANEITSPIDWLKATENQRKKLYPVAKAIKDKSRINDWNKFMALFLSVPINYSSDYRGIIRSGRMKRVNAFEMYNWIVANHLEVGQRLAPDIFPKSMTTPWEGFLAEHGIYGALHTTNPVALGLSRRDGDLPIADDPIKFREPYCFAFKSSLAAQAIILECHEGEDWYPIPIGDTEHDLPASIEAKQNVLPWDNQSNKPVALREDKDHGLRQFVLLLGSDDIADDIKALVTLGKPINPTVLNEIAHAFTSSDNKWEVHRLNVVFMR